jgi:hypothetical protein
MARTAAAERKRWRALRHRLRRAGWNVGTITTTPHGVRVELWPVPHTGPAEGVEPRLVVGASRIAALRTVVKEHREHREPSSAVEP